MDLLKRSAALRSRGRRPGRRLRSQGCPRSRTAHLPRRRRRLRSRCRSRRKLLVFASTRHSATATCNTKPSEAPSSPRSRRRRRRRPAAICPPARGSPTPATAPASGHLVVDAIARTPLKSPPAPRPRCTPVGPPTAEACLLSPHLQPNHGDLWVVDLLNLASTMHRRGLFPDWSPRATRSPTNGPARGSGWFSIWTLTSRMTKCSSPRKSPAAPMRLHLPHLVADGRQIAFTPSCRPRDGRRSDGDRPARGTARTS